MTVVATFDRVYMVEWPRAPLVNPTVQRALSSEPFATRSVVVKAIVEGAFQIPATWQNGNHNQLFWKAFLDVGDTFSDAQ